MEKIGKTNDNLNICKLTDTEMAFVELAVSLSAKEPKIERPTIKVKRKYKRKIIGGVSRVAKSLRHRKLIEVDGLKLTRREVSDKFKIPYVTVCGRILKGWPDSLVVSPTRGSI